MVRSHTPMISAASHQVILFAMAFKITSCSFIIRSSSAAVITGLVSKHQRLRPLCKADRYRANYTGQTYMAGGAPPSMKTVEGISAFRQTARRERRSSLKWWQDPVGQTDPANA